ncbi:helix-turn-helix transcriptional regulator [uncultured Ramlibacter sp.]|uniref:helix-turn-helix transcriptional regulator n=1 Tax=uncultured Ramlibacter sp. TaxID=260755 RepID=UPI00260A1575|nr:helix-turn-helix transcriptional regulator [uncultured Ramlibacter sp.]
MPQDRKLIADGSGLRVERVRSHATAPQWSPVYRAPSRRLVLPGSGAARLRCAGSDLLIDTLTAFRVGQDLAYQLRPELPDERDSVVVSEAPGAGVAQELAQAWLLPPAALYRLRLHWLALQAGGAQAQATAQVLGQALHSAVALASGVQQARPVLRARSFLLSQAGGRATLQEVADAACSSPFHLARSFRRALGLGLHQYRQRLRLATALAWLEEGERDLADLAHELGFCSQSHFGEVFRRELGLSPARARVALARATAGI